MSSTDSGRLARPLLPLIALLLAFWAHPVLAECDNAAAQEDCAPAATTPIPLVLDGRLSDPVALPPPVSSPVLDATLDTLRKEQAAIEMRMRLLEHQGPVRAAPRASPQIVRADQPAQPLLQTALAYVAAHAQILIAALASVLAVGALLLMMRRSQARKVIRERDEALALRPVPPAWSGDMEFDLKPFVFADRR
ncbi:hypothetical protein [Silvimonas iriomotensis]|uniref:Uncharacterized protein n=1 Tax=Silvimonas iriomotensis TaxID=449662 RepID=A0ABQ2PED9_9NEIS|nr:hypothetical protein [Silvimonas iriomotensis]GGP23923.1 hypothetical protein GCM10010970_39230 [Silvimonas iriomotensis]